MTSGTVCGLRMSPLVVEGLYERLVLVCLTFYIPLTARVCRAQRSLNLKARLDGALTTLYLQMHC